MQARLEFAPGPEHVAGLNHDARRKLRLRAERLAKRPTIQRPFETAEIPEGSQLSDQMLELIQGGQYRLVADVNRATSRPSLKERKAQGRRDRLSMIARLRSTPNDQST